jgi:putative DNA primase/helicase
MTDTNQNSKTIPGISASDIQAEALRLLSTDLNQVSLAHNDVLNEILESLEPVDFRAEAELDDKEKVPQKTYVVVTVREVIRVAEALDCGLCKNGDFVYCYNGAFWKRLEKDVLAAFLGKAAEKCGIDAITAEHYQFREYLLKQFLASAHLSKPEPENDVCLVNLMGGTFEVTPNRFTLREFRREDFLTYQLGFVFDQNAPCPKWQKFLDEVLPDKQRQEVLAEYIGYTFTNLKLEKTLMLYGTGANGKSVFFDAINALLGKENVSNYTLEALGHPYYRAMIGDKLLNYSSEISNQLHAEKFKQLTSGEPVEARLPYGQPMTLTKYARLAFNCNELPREVEHTEAFFRRFLIVPFDVTVPEEKRNYNLAREIIEEELPGVFCWVLQGLQRLLDQGKFSDCEAARIALEAYRKESDSVAMFLEDQNMVKHPTKSILLKELYVTYREFCQTEGFRPLNKKNFSKRLRQVHGYLVDRQNDGIRVFCDIPQQ